MSVLPIVTFLITYLLIVVILRTRLSKLAIDKPNARSLHKGEVPRIGGGAIIGAVLVSWLWLSWQPLWCAFILVLMLLFFLDDIFDLPASIRFVVQLLLSYFYTKYLLGYESSLHIVLMVLLITWAMNLYNFMDGSDGLSGGMSAIGFFFYALVAMLKGDANFAVLALCITSSSIAFLIFNFQPARIFMGDMGSIPLGFLMASMGAYGYQHSLWPAWFPFIVFSPFIVDATVTLIKRILKREMIWKAHRSHYYQRLIQMGWGHRKTAIAEYILMIVAGLAALALLNHGMLIITLSLALLGAVFLIVMWQIDKHWVKRKQANDSFR